MSFTSVCAHHQGYNPGSNGNRARICEADPEMGIAIQTDWVRDSRGRQPSYLRDSPKGLFFLARWFVTNDAPARPAWVVGDRGGDHIVGSRRNGGRRCHFRGRVKTLGLCAVKQGTHSKWEGMNRFEGACEKQ
jgi:hypothetical protein